MTFDNVPDTLRIARIACIASIGVTPEERTMKQRLLVDVAVATDIRGAARSDSLADAMDYSKIVPVIVKLAASRDFHLIETLAEAIAECVLSEFGGQAVQVAVTKTPVLSSPVDHVAIEIVRNAK